MTMNKIILIFVTIIIIIAAGAAFFASRSSGLLGTKAEATIGEEKFSLNVADTPEKRQKGLSNTRSLGDKNGMLFVFDEPTIPAFWMKEMNFPIDIIFLNNERVITVFPNVQAPKEENDPLPTYQPISPSNRVIEVKAGTVERLKIVPGNEIQVSL